MWSTHVSLKKSHRMSLEVRALRHFRRIFSFYLHKIVVYVKEANPELPFELELELEMICVCVVMLP